jgi:cell shape-determining protein MreD
VKRAPVAWLAVIVGASFLFRAAAGWLKATPALLPDEYIYASIGRSLAESGQPLVRGGSAHFPALLEPILTAPAWLISDVGVAYRVVQTIGALAMSLAAVPVYLLARRLGLSQRVGLALAALAVLVPDLVYASLVGSEPFAYPLFLSAVAAATAALIRPTRRAQLAFVLFTGLAILARVQFVVLPVVFVLAVFSLGLRERRVRSALREQLLPLCLFVVPLLGLVVVGPGHAFGFYHGALHPHLHPIAFLRWTGWDAMALAYASGWIIVPGALLGLWLVLRRPQSRPELAFAVLACLLAVVLVAEAGLLQTSSSGASGVAGLNEIKERYLFYLVPLVGICFALYARRGWPLRLPHLVLAAGLVVVSVRAPLSNFAAAETINASPILYGVYWLTHELGRESSASLIVAAAAALLSGLGVAGSRRPQIGTPLALALALFATAAASAGAVAFDVNSTSAVRRAYLPADPSFVDSSGLRNVALLQSWGGRRIPTLQQLFWNRSLTRLLLLPGAGPVDVFRDDRVDLGADGSLLVGGTPYRGPLLVDGFGSYVRLRGAREVAQGPVSTLWAPAGKPRLELYAIGRYFDNWLADVGAVYIWPQAKGAKISGWLSMRLTAPPEAGKVTLRLQLPGGKRTTVHVHPGAMQRLNVAVCGNGSRYWYMTFHSSAFGWDDSRRVSVKATAPVFTPSPSACRTPEPVA